MRRTFTAAVVVLLAAACRHPTQVGEAGTTARQAEKEKRGETPAQKGVPPRGERPRVPASPKALLAEGEIEKIQDALARRGYLGKRRAGELDEATTNAIREFQRAQRLAQTGFPDRLTLQTLGIDPEAAYGKVTKEAKGEGGEGSAGSGAGGSGDGGGGKGGVGKGGGSGGGRDEGKQRTSEPN